MVRELASRHQKLCVGGKGSFRVMNAQHDLVAVVVVVDAVVADGSGADEFDAETAWWPCSFA